jgi:hypothetical protein
VVRDRRGDEEEKGKDEDGKTEESLQVCDSFVGSTSSSGTEGGWD